MIGGQIDMSTSRIDKILNISIKDQYYLHYKFLQVDIRAYIEKYYTNGIVLDVGAGNQPYRELFCNCEKYIAMDVDGTNKNLDIISDYKTMPIEDKSIDFVLCTQVLEHTNEPAKLFFEVHRVLKDGGLFLLTCPMNWEMHEIPYDYFRYTYYGIEYLSESADFEIVEYNEQGGVFAVAGQTILNHKKLPLRKIVIPIVNIIFGFLDKLFYDGGNTLNYIFMLRKRTKG